MLDAARQTFISQPLSVRAYGKQSIAASWEELFEASGYYDRVAELMENAQHSILIVGWQIDSRLPLRPEKHDGTFPKKENLKQKLIRLCDEKPDLQIYILMWDHAWFYVYEREVGQGRIWENIHPRVHFIFDNRHPLGASHHEKLCIFDGHVALCGGIDLCGDRWDTPAHLHHDIRRSFTMRSERHGPYHDLGVQVSGPIVRELHQHVAERWELISNVPLPPAPVYPPDSRGHTVYFSRTLAPIDFEKGQPHVTREIEFLYRDLIDRAEKRLILEGQYYWSEAFNDLLIKKIKEKRGTDFEIILILADLRKVKSLTRLMSQYELRLLARLTTAAQTFGVKLFIGNPHSYPENDHRHARPIYVHSKIMIVDDTYLSIGSANFAARAFRLDSEVNLTLEAHTSRERRHIEQFAQRLLSHWNTPTVKLRPLNPSLLLHHRRGAGRIFERPAPNFTWIPWEFFFDPEMSPLYPLKRWLIRWIVGRHPYLVFTGKSILTAVCACLALFFSKALPLAAMSADTALRTSLYAFALCAVWAARVPYLPLALWASWDLTRFDPELAVRLPIAAFWIASLSGYVATRMFPGRAELLYGKWKNSPLAHRLASRSFRNLLSAAFDLRVPLHYKIAFEGIYCMPFAWFALVNGLLVPSVLYVALSLWVRAWIAFAPQLMVH